ncbi:MAG: DEAD/DEAH box helicase [Spirochaetaceae bacterium]|jgi:ATP-dependent Lhr-like helicase|nr:DEAD/DEAH box helicase [Spirochaetaceae bacterium]
MWVVPPAQPHNGKTEAAFLPILTRQLGLPAPRLAVYVSPLSALINDQFRRLNGLCERLLIPVHPWHGGISASAKKHFFERPEGVLLITPESLQALFCNHGFEIPRLFSGILYIVVDELHSFIGSERGKQVQTLLHLLDLRTGQKVTRIGLSATLGNMELAASFLSGFGAYKRHCEIIEAEDGASGKKMNLPASRGGGADPTANKKLRQPLSCRGEVEEWLNSI